MRPSPTSLTLIYQKPVRAREVISKSISHLDTAFGYTKDVGTIMFAMNIARLPPSLQEGLIPVTADDIRNLSSNFVKQAGGDARQEAGKKEDGPAVLSDQGRGELLFEAESNWQLTKRTSIPQMIAFRALCRAVSLDFQVNDEEIRAMWSFAMGDEFLIAFNRMGMMHLIPEIVFGLLSIHALLPTRDKSTEAGTERLVHEMLCKISEVTLNFSKRHLCKATPTWLSARRARMNM